MNAAGHDITAIYMSGGQAKNAMLMQLFANTCSMPVVLPKSGGDAVVLGSAMLGRFAHRAGERVPVPLATLAGFLCAAPLQSRAPFMAVRGPRLFFRNQHRLVDCGGPMLMVSAMRRLRCAGLKQLLMLLVSLDTVIQLSPSPRLGCTKITLTLIQKMIVF